jgi:prenyltransferase beta subunit
MLIRRPSAWTIAAAAMVAAVCATVTSTAVCPARAASARDPKFQTNVERTVRYLQNSQQEDGGFAEPGTQPGSDFTAWVALALAAAGINPRDQTTAKQHYAAGHSAYSYLAEHAHDAYLTTDFERELLVVDAAGTSPHDFGGVDLVGEILKRQITTGANKGAFPHEAGSRIPGINDTIFAILALSPVHEPAVQEAIGQTTEWLEAQQKCDGSWNWVYRSRAGPCPQARRLLPGEERGEVDMTGAALQALNATKHPDSNGQERAFAYLREAENPDGGFPEFLANIGEKAEESNVASTAWVVQAMWSAGQNPEDWVSKGATGEPLGYLASMQQEDGHIRYEASEELNGMWMTAYAAPAFFGDPWPPAEAPYEELPALPPEEPTSGNGGVSGNPGSGVIAGGGGKGAPLFSRPQPKSKGRTPGGARQLSDKHESARKRSARRSAIKHPRRAGKPHRNPGAPRKTPVLTTVAAPAAELATSHRGPGTGTTSTGAGSGARQTGAGRALPALGAVGGQASGREVRGVVIGAAGPSTTASALEPGAPGLRSAGAGHSRTPWPAIAIGAALLLAALLGMQIERRRPQVIL